MGDASIEARLSATSIEQRDGTKPTPMIGRDCTQVQPCNARRFASSGHGEKPMPKIASDCTEVQPCNAIRC
eukprot:scaffold140643_cov148-Phaeocystis_antarctica.AAC.1